MKAKYIHVNANLKLKWKCQLDRPVIEESCEDRGWTMVGDDDDDFHFAWLRLGNI